MIRIDLLQHTALNFSLVDMNGRILTSSEIKMKEGYQAIDLTNVQNGIYFVKITLDDGSYVTKKLVVQR